MITDWKHTTEGEAEEKSFRILTLNALNPALPSAVDWYRLKTEEGEEKKSRFLICGKSVNS